MVMTWVRAAIYPPDQVACPDLSFPTARASCKTRFGKVQRQIVLAQHRKHIHALLHPARPQYFDNFTFGIGVTRLPILRNSTTTLSLTFGFFVSTSLRRRYKCHAGIRGSSGTT